MNKISALLIALTLTACASTATKQEDKPAQADTPPAAQTQPAQPAATASTAQTEAATVANQIQELQKQSVYFDFDKYAIKPEFRDTIGKQAEFLKTNKNVSVTLEGNADERGSSEYNLALGSRRANAVKANLKTMGVAEGRMQTTSFGEEKPRMTCHEEKCWQENRRVDFAHKAN